MNRYTHQFSARRYFLVDQTVIVSSAIDEAVNQVLLWTVQAIKRIAIVTARTKIVFAALWKYIASRMSRKSCKGCDTQCDLGGDLL